jgi:DNA polymerase-1
MIYLVTNQITLFAEFTIISLEKSLELLEPLKIVGVDSETEGLDRFTKKMLSLQLGNKDIQIVLDLSTFGCKLPQSIIDYLQSDRLFIFQNAKFDLQFLYIFHCVPTKVYDTYLAEIILTNGLQYDGRGLDDLVHKYCPDGYMVKGMASEIVKYGMTPEAIKYAANDVVYLEDIMNAQMKQVKYLHMETAINIDNSFVKVLAYIEFCGIKLDTVKWQQKCERDVDLSFERKLVINKWLIDNDFGEYFGTYDLFTGEPECIINWDSPKQVIQLFEKIGINCDKVDKGVKSKSCDAKTLEPQTHDFPIIPIYLEYKEAKLLVSTFGKTWFNHISKVTGRIHTRFNQLMNTGRLSCGGKDKLSGTQWPNLQNLPKDQFTRSCFISEPGYSYVCADFSGQEQIVLANVCQDKALLSFYQNGLTDMHSFVALLMYEDIRNDLGITDILNITNDHLLIVKKKYSKFRTIAKSAGFAINLYIFNKF